MSDFHFNSTDGEREMRARRFRIASRSPTATCGSANRAPFHTAAPLCPAASRHEWYEPSPTRERAWNQLEIGLSKCLQRVTIKSDKWLPESSRRASTRLTASP